MRKFVFDRLGWLFCEISFMRNWLGTSYWLHQCGCWFYTEASK